MIRTLELTEITAGSWIVSPINDDLLYGGCFDTRRISDEEIFFAWKGEHADGHNFLDKLAGTSVKVAIVEKDTGVYPPGVAILKTDHSLHALWKIATAIYHRFEGKTIAVTGSNGKTTAKTWLAEILNTAIPVHFAEGSFNNHVGCPITFLKLKPIHQAVILEVGANAIGEIDHLTGLFPPDMAIILNVGYAHVGKFGGIDKTYAAKCEIIRHLKPGGILFIPGDDKKLMRLATEKLAEINQPSALKFYPQHQISILKSTPLGQEIELSSKTERLHVMSNVLGKFAGRLFSLILSVAEELNISSKTLKAAFSNLENVSGRMTLKHSANGAYILDDTYNANPNSVAHLVALISEWDMAEKYLILGNLAELDEDDDRSAKIIADEIKSPDLHIFAVGEIAGRIGQLVSQKSGCRFSLFPDKASAVNICKKLDKPNVIFGIKGSNSAKLWEITHALTDQ